ncbi:MULTISPECIES: hypothetical protein [Streptococcus]|jgi:hypothetical protein|uniref:Uncharacterized protein n=1 Tax=Streptococcus mitis TaxID=28037 RepID=A0A1X1KYA9_STRMT|nr:MULTISPECIES: hypothetical protein [Streptococcus]ORP04299.1 hypothetical protein B7695_02865 [Streptococcus mitis]
MKEIFKELDDLSALDLPIELRKILATYINSEVQGRVSSFVNLSLVYSDGRYTDFIRSYMYLEFRRKKMLDDMQEICRYL